jgi:peptide/nickel transport system permease protein
MSLWTSRTAFSTPAFAAKPDVDVPRPRLQSSKHPAISQGSHPAALDSLRTGYLYQTADRLRRDRIAMFGLGLVLIVTLMALLSPGLPLADPYVITAKDRLASPSWRHILGADELGRDLLSRIFWGARSSLPIALSAATISVGAGIFLGLLAGHLRGSIDLAVMRVIDAVQALPGILLALALLTVLGLDVTTLIIALAVARIPDIARLMRGSALSVGSELYIEAARAVGADGRRIVTKHILPNSLAPMLVAATSSLGLFILAEASLSFLGVGIQPPTPSWGTMLTTGKVYMDVSLWVTLWPGLAIFITVLGFNLLGDGLRDATDPRLRSRT